MSSLMSLNISDLFGLLFDELLLVVKVLSVTWLDILAVFAIFCKFSVLFCVTFVFLFDSNSAIFMWF